MKVSVRLHGGPCNGQTADVEWIHNEDLNCPAWIKQPYVHAMVLPPEQGKPRPFHLHALADYVVLETAMYRRIRDYDYEYVE